MRKIVKTVLYYMFKRPLPAVNHSFGMCKKFEKKLIFKVFIWDFIKKWLYIFLCFRIIGITTGAGLLHSGYTLFEDAQGLGLEDVS